MKTKTIKLYKNILHPNLVKYLSLITFLLSLASLNAQEVVISEYKNASSPNAEWAELLVIGDNIDISGYSLRDNVGSNPPPAQWQGGIKFRNLDLWKHLRQGTIIVINFRDCPAGEKDTNKSDGYIEVGANDAVFDKVFTNCDSSTWSFKALSIAQSADLLQLLDAAGNNVHALGHMPSSGGDFTLINGGKISFKGGIVNNYTVRVVPGNNLNEYNQGFDNSTSFTAASTDESKGKPNTSSSYPNENHKYWRQLRQPDWFNPMIYEYSVDKSFVSLKWTLANDSYSLDLTLGYLILRIPESDLTGALSPEDGKIYSPGDNLGTGTVIYCNKNSNFIDAFAIPCGESYFYRIYAYRYSADNQNEDVDPTFARGCSYNETSFAEIKIKKELPKKPVLQTKDNRTIFCKGTTATITDTVSNSNVKYQWTKGGVLVVDYPEGTNELTVSQSGIYQIVAMTEMGCTDSTSIEITFVDEPPHDILLENNSKILSDTNIYICKGNNCKIKTNGTGTIQWYKDSNPLTGENSTTLNITSDGIYHALIWESLDCRAESYKITVSFIEEDFSADKDSLDFNLAKGESFQDKDLIIQNSSDYQLIFNQCDIALPQDFSIILPVTQPYIIEPHSNLTFKIRFMPTKSGDVQDSIVFHGKCSTSLKVKISGILSATSLVSEYNFYDFLLILSCDAKERDTLIKITNAGTVPVTIGKPDISIPFLLISPTVYPFNLDAGQSQDFHIRFNANLDAIYQQTMLVPFSDGSSQDTLRIQLKAQVLTPDFIYYPDSILFTLEDCNSYKDTAVVVRNTSLVPITFKDQSSFPVLKYMNLPLTIGPGGTDTLIVRFQPRDINDLDADFVVSLFAIPCTVQKFFKVRGTSNGNMIGISNDGIIDFDTIVHCSPQVNDTSKTFHIYLAGHALMMAKVESIIISPTIAPYINISLKVGDVLSNPDNPVLVTFLACPNGTYYGTIKIKFDLCNIEKTIQFKAARYSPTYSISTGEIDFGTATIPNIGSGSFTVTNTGEIPVTVSGITGLTSIFILLNNTIPVLLLPDSSYKFNLEYRQGITSSDSIDIKLLIDEPCPLSSLISLIGNAVKPDTDAIAVFLPSLTAKPGDIIKIPIRVSTISHFNLNEMGIDSIYMRFRYNMNVLYPTGIQSGDAIINDVNTITLTNNLGYSDINISIKDPTKIDVGEWAVLSGIALLGDTLYSELIIDSLRIFSQKPIDFGKAFNGILTIQDNCSLDKRIISASGQVGFYLDNIPQKDNAELHFYTVSEKLTTIKLYDIYGNLFKDIVSGSFKPGGHTISFGTDQLSDGLYFIIMRSGNLMRSGKMVMLR